ncbi:arginine-tRNA-protein transferase [Cunninghamella echinulata]|nr:arginine-tRNA-protein transferase [Cunninghamella echinulata]
MPSSFVSIVGFNNSDCGYCHQDNTSYTFGLWAHSLSCKDYQALIDRGWRRSGKYLYKPNLRKSCCPQYTIRLDTTEFKVSKSQRKIINKFNKYIEGTWQPAHEMINDNSKETTKKKKGNNNIEPTTLIDMIRSAETNSCKEGDYAHSFKIEMEPSSYTDEKFALYCKYQKEIHHDEPDELKPEQFKRFLVDTPLQLDSVIGNDGLTFGSYHQKYILDDKLIAVAVLDILPYCVSSVYYMYDPDYSFLGLGNYSALREISLTQELYMDSKELKYYYMGYYIHSCVKMKYKGKYHPSYLLDPEAYEWFSLDKVCIPLLDKHKYVSFSNPENSTKQQLENNKNGNEDNEDHVDEDSDDDNYEICPPGWLDRSTLTDKDFGEVVILAGQNMVVPVTYLEDFDDHDSTIRKEITNFVAAVGLKLAKRIVIC